GNGIAWPYGRCIVPAQPLHVGQLPPDLRDVFGRVQFPLRFADAAFVQPAETHRVASVEPAYLTANGKVVRRVRDNAIKADPTYEEFYSEMTEGQRRWLEGITIEPLDA